MDKIRPQLDEVLDLALKLSPKERIQLIERVASSVGRDIEIPLLEEKQPLHPEAALKSGAEIVAMLEQMEPIEFVDEEITDPVEWVKAQRKKEMDRLKPYWDGKS